MKAWGRFRRGAVVMVALGVVAAAGPALAADGADQPTPCTVTYDATPHGAGAPITTTFAVSCTPEVTSIDQQTTLRDTTLVGAQNTCLQQVPGSTATQHCSVTGSRFHTYVVNYHLKAWGNLAVCEDDGACDPNTPLLHPACASGETDAHPVDQPNLVLDCTYRLLVTVLGSAAPQ